MTKYMGSNAAVRQRRHRDRERNGMARYELWVRDDWLITVLVSAELLSPELEDDRGAVAAALQRAIELWITPPDVTRNGTP